MTCAKAVLPAPQGDDGRDGVGSDGGKGKKVRTSDGPGFADRLRIVWGAVSFPSWCPCGGHPPFLPESRLF